MYRGNSSRANSPPRRHRCMTAGRDAPDAANTLKRDPPTVYPPSWALCPRSRALSWRVSAGDCSRASRAGPLASARAGPCTAATEPGAAAGGWELVRRVAHAAHPAPHMRAVPAALAGRARLTVCHRGQHSQLSICTLRARADRWRGEAWSRAPPLGSSDHVSHGLEHRRASHA